MPQTLTNIAGRLARAPHLTILDSLDAPSRAEARERAVWLREILRDLGVQAKLMPRDPYGLTGYRVVIGEQAIEYIVTRPKPDT